MASSEPSAVAKVFALPELLEHILICLAETTLDAQEKLRAEGKITESESLQPLMCLSAVQRVNIAFRDATKSSKHLRQLIARPLVRKEDVQVSGGEKEQEKPLRVTLLNGTLKLAFYPRNKYIRMVVSGYEHASNSDKQSLRCYRSDHQEDSWRNVRIFDDEEVCALARFEVTDGKYTYHSSRTWELGRSATLGRLFDCWERLGARRGRWGVG